MHTIKTAITLTGDGKIKLWRNNYGYLQTVFFLDVYKDGALWTRQCYDTLNDGLDAYYSMVSAAFKTGHSLERVNNAN